MSQRFEEDFNKLGNIYEAYFAKKAGGQSDIVQGSPSYRKGYMQPGGSVNSYAANEIPTTATIISDEETSPLLDKIDALMKEAEDNAHGHYAILQLNALKEFIQEQD